MRKTRPYFLAGAGLLMLLLAAFLVTAALAGEKDKESRPWLGVALSGEDEGDAGVLIIHVVEDSPAEEAGIEDGEWLIKIEGVDVGAPGEITRLLRKHQPGDRVELVVGDDEGEERTLVVTLDERPSPFVLKLGEHLNLGEGFGLLPHIELGSEGDDEVKIFIGGHGVARAYLGVELTQPSDQLREYFGASEDQGVLINRVLKGSPADHAGLRAGDLILALGDQTVAGSGELIEALGDHEPGDTVTLELLRDRSRMDLSVELGENPHGASTIRRHWIQKKGEGPSTIELKELIEKSKLEALERAHEAQEALAATNFQEVQKALERAQALKADAFVEAQEAFRKAVRLHADDSVHLLREEDIRIDLQKMLEQLHDTLEDLKLELEEIEELPTPPARHDDRDRIGPRLIAA